MRLTLRTMLAYLDDLLEPADRADIANKLKDSEFASQLVERIKNRMRNAKLASPKLSGRGMALDPNTAAEYLDNTLAAERVPEFEKMCLPPAETGDALVESDVYLAEVAACHQILAMVLGQPAHVDPEMKRRMYGIINEVPPMLPARGTNGSADDIRLEPEDERPRAARQRPEIPEYLRDRGPRSSWKPIIAAILLFALLVGAITMALGPIDQLLGLNQPAKNAAPEVANATNDKPPPQPQANDNNAAPIAADTANAADANKSTQNGSTPTTGAVGDRYADPAAPGPAPIAPTPTQPATSDLHLPDAINPPANAANSNTAVGASSTNVGSAAPPPLPQPPVNAATASSPKTDQAGSQASPLPSDTAIGAAIGSAPGTPTNPKAAINQTPTPPAPANESPLGRVVPGSNVVLLKFDPASSHWARLAAGSALSNGDQLLVLPTYRPTITLSAGVTLQLAPETLVSLGGVDADGTANIKVLYGRVVAMTTGKAGARLRIDVGANSGIATFTDADATLGIEVRRYFMAGTNPELQQPKTAADLYAASGHIEWTGQDGVAATLSAPQRWPLTSPMPDAPAIDATSPAAIPKWIANEPTNPLYNRASEALTASLDADKPFLTALREMASTSRRAEFKTFAAECLGQVDEFEPLISMLNDPEQRAMWPLEIGSIKSALSRGQPTAVAVREAFEKQRGEAGKDLYRMFWGYTKDQLQNGEAAKLVEFLDHDNLDFRVLAFNDLQEITKAHHNYRPEATDQGASSQREVGRKRSNKVRSCRKKQLRGSEIFWRLQCVRELARIGWPKWVRESAVR